MDDLRVWARTLRGSSLVPRYSVNLDSRSSSTISGLLLTLFIRMVFVPLTTLSPWFLLSVRVLDLLGLGSLYPPSPMISLWTLWIFLMGLLLVAEARVLGVLSTTLPECSLRTGMWTSRLGLDLVRGGRVGDVLGDLRTSDLE